MTSVSSTVFLARTAIKELKKRKKKQKKKQKQGDRLVGKGWGARDKSQTSCFVYTTRTSFLRLSPSPVPSPPRCRSFRWSKGKFTDLLHVLLLRDLLLHMLLLRHVRWRHWITHHALKKKKKRNENKSNTQKNPRTFVLLLILQTTVQALFTMQYSRFSKSTIYGTIKKSWPTFFGHFLLMTELEK